MTTNGRFQVADAFKHLDPNQALASGLTSGFSRIGMKGKTWKVIHQGESYFFVHEVDGTIMPLPYLDVVIVGANQNTSKLYYPAGTYTEDATNAPTCASTNGDRPDPGVAIPQSVSCSDCKHNQWLPNRGGKECQDHRRLAVRLLPYMKTKPRLAAPIETPVFLKVPPASLKSFKSYSDMLSGDRVHYASVITRITFDPVKQFQMNFDVFKALTNAEAPAILPLLADNSPQTRSLIGGITEIKQIEHRTPPLPPERQEAGVSVFEQAADVAKTIETPAPAKRVGRPRKAPEEAKETAGEEPAQEAAPWEEPQDADLDKMMGDVLGKMMK